MTTIAELVDTPPAATHGVLNPLPRGDGDWYDVVEIADPDAGSDVEWFDITTRVAGSHYTRGADQPFGRYKASVVTIDLYGAPAGGIDDNSLAPWNPDTSPTFGVHVDLGPGLLIRRGFIRVVDDVVVEWNPRWTTKVEDWGDASFAEGQIRLHRVVARDTSTSLVDVPIAASIEENWYDRAVGVIEGAGWQYGYAIYGAQLLPGPVNVLTLPARDDQTSAINELDTTLDPAGCIWFTNRKGQLIVRPSPIDTFHHDQFLAGATGDEFYIDDEEPVLFTHLALDDDGTLGHVDFAIDDDLEPVGVGKNEAAVVNHVVREAPGGTFDDDNAVSIRRFDRKTSRQNWLVENDQVAQDLLDAGPFRTVYVSPIYTSADMHGFLPRAGIDLDYIGAAAIEHQPVKGDMAVAASGTVRGYVETMTTRTDTSLNWEIVWTLDVFASSVSAAVVLFPVEDLALEAAADTSAEFSWTNPAQDLDPTHTQIRMLNPASLWSTVAYPITGVVWNALDPDTDYEFQVRLIRVAGGLITNQSPSRSLPFHTPFTVPIIVIDDGTDGTVTFPPPPCGTLDWELQESDDGVTWSMVDSGTVTTPPWTVAIDAGDLDGEKLYRVKQDACGVVTYSKTFGGICTTAPALGDAPFDDADLEFYLPQRCPPDIIVEAVSDETAQHGPQFGTTGYDADLDVLLVSAGEGPVVFGLNTPGIDGLTGDATISIKVYLTTQPADPTNPVVLFAAVGLAICAVPEGAGWKLRVEAWEEGAGITALTDDAELDLDTWYTLTLQHDVVAGDLTAYIDGLSAVSALGSVGERHDPGLYIVGNAEASVSTNAAIWSRVLILPPTVTINKGSGQADPVTGGDVVFDVVFSEAVTGFVSADVTLSGTAGATTKVVAGSGATYTVTVSGMTATGTVIASIGAAVCTAVATGLPNEASTSTDNSVAWTLPFNVITSIPWKHLYYAGGPAFQAQGLANGATMNGSAGHTFPDEIATNAAPLNSGAGTYQSSPANMNGKPCVANFSTSAGLDHNATVAAGAQQALPFTVVVIWYMSSPANYVVDGANQGSSGNRVLLRISSGPVWSLYMGTDRTAGVPTAGLKAARIHATSGNDVLTVNGSTIISGVDSGGGTWQGMSWNDGPGVVPGGLYAFYGLYPGDLTAHANWSAFQAWVLATYGVSIS